MTIKFSNKVDLIISYLYRGLILILPLFFLPWIATSTGSDNYNKLYLLWLVVPLLFFLQYWRALQEKKNFWQKNFLNLPIIIFLIATFLSAIATSDKFTALWGEQSSFILPAFALAVFILFYYVSITLKPDEKETVVILKLLTIGFLAVITGASLIFFGVLSRNPTFASAFKFALGSMEELAMYLAVMSSLLAMVLTGNQLQLGFILTRAQRIMIKFGLFFSLVILVIVNFVAAWVSLFLGVSFFFALLSRWKYQEKGKTFFARPFFKNIFWLVLFLAFSLIFIFLNLTYFDRALTTRRYAQNLRLDAPRTWHLAGNTIKHRPILGYGPETFANFSSLERNASLNSTDYWSLRFNKGGSYLAELIITNGVLGLLSYLFFIGVFFVSITKIIKNIKKLNQAEPLTVFFTLLFSSLVIALIGGQIFFSTNANLQFLFWLFLALFVTYYYRLLFLQPIAADSQKKLAGNNLQTRFIFAAIVLLFFAWLALIGFAGKYWLANFYYQKGLKQVSAGQSEQAIGKIKQAINFNQRNVNYKIVLAKLYLKQGMNALTIAPGKNGAVDYAVVQASFTESVKWAQAAVTVAPDDVASWETLGGVYRDVSSYLTAANENAIRAFTRAFALEPTNPVLATELGKVYATAGQMEKAIEFLQKAIALKDNYYDAKFNLAKIYIDQGKNGDALVELSNLENKYDSVAIYSEEGKAHFNEGQYDKAIASFRQVLSTDPINANALYSLGLSFVELKENKEALYYFKKVAQLNPNNQEVKKKIEELEKKK